MARNAYPVCLLAALLWGGALAAFVVGYEGRGGAFTYAPFRWAVAAALALLPMGFMLLFGYAVRQTARLAAEARRARAMADELTLPAGLAAAETTGLLAAVRAEIGRAAETAIDAGRSLTRLQEQLAQETKAVGEAALQAERSARTLSGRLQAERADLSALAGQLGAQTQDLTETVTRHAQLLADAAEGARVRATDAEAMLAGRAAQLLAGAAEAGRAAEVVGGELAHQTGRLHTLTSDLRDERDDLARTADALMAEEESLATRLEGRRGRLAEVAVEARTGVETLSAQATAGAERLNHLIQEAAAALRVAGDEARAQEDELDARARERLSLFSGVVAEERATIEGQTRAALDRVAQAAQAARASAEDAGARMAEQVEAAATAAEQSARRQVDELAEAAFTAGQHVDHAFDVRLAAARRTLEAAASLVEEAGARSAARVETGLSGVRDVVDGLQSLLAELDLKLSHAPQEAAARAAQVSAAMEQGVDALVAAARRALEETQTLDAAFQERVRRNAASAPPPPEPPPAADRRPSASSPAERSLQPEPRRPTPSLHVGEGLNGLNEHAPAAPPLRPRLRLTPTREDEAVRALFEPVAEAATTPPPSAAADRPAPIAFPAAAPSSTDDGWSWKDLLTTLDDGAQMDEETLAGRIVDEIAALGVDSEALLPASRTEEIAQAFGRGETGAARDSVRRLAPAAIRRLSRRVQTDRVLRDQIDQYRAAFGERLREAARRQGASGAAGLLGSEPGRAWLLVDAAADRPQALA